jgi:prevent-host-death family protein
MKIKVGSCEAKTKLPELLRGVQRGNRYTITLRGEAVAELIPLGTAQTGGVTAAVAQMHKFMASHPPIRGIDTKILIEDGRD